MKIPSFIALAGIGFGALGLPATQAADLTPPVVARAVPDLTVSAGAPAKVINLGKIFALRGVQDEVARFTTTLGSIDVELFAASTPKTVANFLAYVHRGGAKTGGYGDSLIARSVPGSLLQGGGYYFGSEGFPEIIDPLAAVPSEAGLPNATGTIALALGGGPASGTSAWFFNLADNAKLNGTKDGGPYTVFGRVIENGMEVIDTIVAVRTYDLSADLGGAFENVPLINFNAAGSAGVDNFIYTKKIAVIPLTPAKAGDEALLKLKVLHNSNPKVVAATLSGRQLKLKVLGVGVAKITLQASDAANARARTSFTVTVK